MPIDHGGSKQLRGVAGLRYLLESGQGLHECVDAEEGVEALIELMEALVRVRDRRGRNVKLIPNRAQLEFERRRGQKNIVLKARQMGISTWVSGRFFLKTITKPREAAMERYYIRMYDGSTPPNYSRFSSAAIVNVAL